MIARQTWHHRLEQALTARNKRWDDLVTITGKKKPSVYAWKPHATKRSEMMDGDNAAIVCNFLGISQVWLFFGEGDSGLGDTPLSYKTNRPALELAAREPNQDEETILAAYRTGNPTAKQLLLAQAKSILEAAEAKKRSA